MADESPDDLVEYLLSRQFRGRGMSRHRLTQPPEGYIPPADPHVQQDALRVLVETRRTELTQLPPKELARRVEAERAKEHDETVWQRAYRSERYKLQEARRKIAGLEAELAEVRGAPNHHWPWGDYKTHLLQVLAKAVEHWWVRYDPSDPSTAPTNEDVAAWIREQQVAGKPVAERVAEILAQIIRADGLPVGRRKK